MHDLILFDLDGTISDPLAGIGKSINYALAHFGFRTIEIPVMAAHVGPPIDETFKKITGVTEQQKIREMVSKYRERYSDVGYSENILYPGMADVLCRFNEAGVRMAICTSKREDFATKILEMFSLRQCFQFVDGGEVGVHKHQQIAALLERGAVTTSTVMVGDRAVDIEAAHENGLSAGAVLWGYGSQVELEQARPQYWFASPKELLSLAKLTFRSTGLGKDGRAG